MTAVWKSSLVAACLTAACGGSDGRRENGPIQDRMASAPQELTLTGCVRPGQLETTFVLEDVRTGQLQPSAQRQPQSGMQGTGGTASPPVITDGSTVQLSAADPAQLRQYVGQEVRVRGTLTDTGASTIGTSGAQGSHTTPSGDRSAAGQTDKSHAEKKRNEAGPIGRDSMANGTAPTIRVSSVEATGQRCPTQQQRVR